MKKIIRNDITESGTLSSSVNSWKYTANIGFSPDYVHIAKVRYYNDGSDKKTYTLKSDMFSNDVQQRGTIFTEGDSTISWSEDTHSLKGSSIDGNTFTFTAISHDGLSQPSAGNITLMLTFVKEI